MSKFIDLFTSRQLIALTTFSDMVEKVREHIIEDCRNSIAFGSDARVTTSLSKGGNGVEAYADSIITYLGFAVSKSCTRNCNLAIWESGMGRLAGAFGRQAMPMQWTFAETNPFAGAGGDFQGTIESLTKPLAQQGQCSFGAASRINAPANNYPVRPTVICTDPPYYDNIGYADLSDFFYVWLKRTIGNTQPDLFRRLVTPKTDELVASPFRHDGKEGAEAHFMAGMGEALTSMRNASADAPLAIFYAFKQSEVSAAGVLSPGWAAFLQAIVDAGLQVDGTWPVRTEATNALKKNMNALAASVVLVCRKRTENAPVLSRRDFLRELKPVMAQAIIDHQKAGIPLPDRRQAAIGPGIGVFSKYSMVREPDDSPMRVATALALINKEIDSLLSEGTQELDPETRFALEWYQMHGYADQKGGSGDAIAQLQAFNLSESRLNASGLFRSKGGDAKLLTRDEMHDAIIERLGKPWRPSLDDTFTVWELAQHMARALRAQDGGVDVAGRLLAERRECGADVLLIAERLFELATTRGENDEALIWNELQTSWPQLENAADRAAEAGVGPAPAQTELEV
jgi:putative DNA methylase